MANTPNYGVDILGATATEVYTCPVGKTAYVIGMWVANISETTQQNVTITREYDALSITRTLVNKAPVAVNGGFSPLPDIGKLVLKAGDVIYGTSANANQLEMGVEVLEVDA